MFLGLPLRWRAGHAMGDITQLSRSANSGDTSVRELFTRMYSDLKRLAHGKLYRNGGRAELNTTCSCTRATSSSPRAADSHPRTARVLRLCRQSDASVVLDTVRERRAGKRGGGLEPLQLTTGMANEVLDDDRLLAIDDALDALGRLAPELRELVEMRYFAGLSVGEISEIGGRSVRASSATGKGARAPAQADGGMIR